MVFAYEDFDFSSKTRDFLYFILKNL